jgi:hypothetical protein
LTVIDNFLHLTAGRLPRADLSAARRYIGKLASSQLLLVGSALSL